MVSVATVIQHNTSSLISLTESGITRPRDLAGHTYGSYGSELEEALIRTLVECDGGDPDAVELAPLSSDDFRIGLLEHQFDAAWVFDAWDTIRLGQIDGLDVSTIPFIDHTDCIPDWYTPLVATSQQHLDEDPELVRDFLAALTHGYEDAIARAAGRRRRDPRGGARDRPGAAHAQRAVARDPLHRRPGALGRPAGDGLGRLRRVPAGERPRRPRVRHRRRVDR